MLTKMSFKNTIVLQCVLFMVCVVFARGCGSAGGPGGGCVQISNKGTYTAAISDLDGKPWVFDLRPAEVEVSCAKADDNGEITFSGVIKDGQGVPKAGLASAAVLSGESPSLERIDKDKVVISDACGGVSFKLKWVCPAVGLAVRGDFVAKSGGLLSSTVKISIQHPTPTPTATPSTASAPSVPAPSVPAPSVPAPSVPAASFQE